MSPVNAWIARNENLLTLLFALAILIILSTAIYLKHKRESKPK